MPQWLYLSKFRRANTAFKNGESTLFKVPTHLIRRGSGTGETRESEGPCPDPLTEGLRSDSLQKETRAIAFSLVCAGEGERVLKRGSSMRSCKAFSKSRVGSDKTK